MNKRIITLAAAFGLAALPVLAAGPIEVSNAVNTGSSAKIKDLPIHRGGGALKEKNEPKRVNVPDGLAPGAPDPALQTVTINAASTTTPTQWDGVGLGGGYTPDAAPPDTNGAVGGPVVNGQSSQYVQWVNEAFAVYDTASGSVVAGPSLGNTLWASFPSSSPCRVYNDGDPIVQWDKINRRWVLTQFAVSQGATSGYRQCVAVSKTEDATGAYNLYEFNYSTNFNDYPKVGVGTDGNYYITYNMFKRGRTFNGGWVCAWNGAAMRAGTNPAGLQQCFTTTVASLLPADLDAGYGSTITPRDEWVINATTNALTVRKLHVDFANSANSSLSAGTNVAVAAYSRACGGGTCIPQPGTSQQLDSLADRLMYRLAFRQFAGYDALFVSHAVTSGSVTGVRWYELRSTGGATPTLFQQGTYQPDNAYRWMSSGAMDKQGNIIVGYSVSSSTIKPDIRFASRAPGDPAGTLGNETAVAPTTRGSQQATLARWGDYASMSVDPADDCTMYFTTEYLKADGKFNWSTRVGKTKVSTCQ
ncbi:MAG TPA: hypothetical protein VJZ00_22595 [Thermoanaerobaculia bacterium]|nr:hypothetical protein [Thermoanaerobaculia bacterium]